MLPDEVHGLVSEQIHKTNWKASSRFCRLRSSIVVMSVFVYITRRTPYTWVNQGDHHRTYPKSCLCDVLVGQRSYLQSLDPTHQVRDVR